jgi:hypothetical protein
MRGGRMHERIEAFMKDVLGLEGENSNAVREGVRRYMAEYEKQVHVAETDAPRKVPAAERFSAGSQPGDRGDSATHGNFDYRTLPDGAQRDRTARRVSH